MLRKIPQIDKSGVAAKITLIIISVAVISAAFAGFLTLYISKKQFSNYVDREGLQIAERYAGVIEGYYLLNGSLEGLNYILNKPVYITEHRGGHGFHQMAARRIIVTDEKGIVVADSSGALLNRKIGSLKNDMFSFPMILDDKQIATFYIFNPLKKGISTLENAFIRNISEQIFNSILIVATLAFLLGIFLARRITLPISALSSGIKEVAKGNLETRLQPYGDKEFILLANSFNLMAEKLYEHEQSRNSLVANIAHELRTPLSILRGQLESIQSGNIKLTAEISSSLVDEIIRLTRLVKDLETVGLVESGALKLNLEDIKIREIIDSITPLRLAMEEREIDFRIEWQEEIETINIDMNRIIQVLINLLTNSMRHLGAGGEIRLKIYGAIGKVIFAVQDNGPGIAPDDLKHIFERFYRVDKSRDREIGGTGLGLAIAKSFIIAHGGEIWAESGLEKGTTFYFSIPRYA